MKKQPVLLILCVLLFASAPQVPGAVLYLKGGHALQGDLSLVEKIYHLKTGTGEIRIAAERVDRVFDRIEEVYEWKRSLIRVGIHSEHIELARWCLEYDLLDPAQQELVAAELAEPGTPMVDYLQCRLTAKRKAVNSDEPRQFVPSPMAKPIPGNSASSIPSAGGEISLTELDRVTKTISPQSLAQFSRTIQPILLNNCATGGCHVGTGGEKMRLYRNVLAGSTTGRTTQRNLHSVMQWITPHQPDFSPILTVPLRPHGKTARPIAGVHREEYVRLVQWVMQVGRDQKALGLLNQPGADNPVQPAMHHEPIGPNPDLNQNQKPSIVRETLDLIPPDGVNVQKRGKDGVLEPLYPGDSVTSTSPLRKALAADPALLKAFIEKEEDGVQRTEDRQ